MSDARMKEMVQELWDREQIRQCVHRYARGVDRFDREMIKSVFHPDFVDDHGKFVGNAEEFVDWALEQHSRVHMSHQHILLNQNCEFQGSDTAFVETYFAFAGMNRKGKPFTLLGGRYIDRFEKRNGEWKVAFRVTVRDWVDMDTTPNIDEQSSFTSTAALLSPEERAFMNAGPTPKRDKTDPSYSRDLKPNPERLAGYKRLTGSAR